MVEKKSFIMYNDYGKHFNMLSDAQAGQLIKAIFEYAESGEVPEFSDGMVKMAFSFISENMLRDSEKYKKICEKRREAVAKRWNKTDTKNTDVYNCKICNTNDTDNDTGIDTVTVTDTDIDIDTGSDSEINNNIARKARNTPHTSDKKICFGEYKHIKLTQAQYDKLVEDYGQSNIDEYIRRMDEWQQLKGAKSYKDYNLALRNWLNRDNVRKSASNSDGFNADDYDIVINNF